MTKKSCQNHAIYSTTFQLRFVSTGKPLVKNVWDYRRFL